MPQGIYKKRDGVIYGNTGKKASPEKLEKLRLSHLGKIPWNKGKKGFQISTRKGKKVGKMSEETRRKIAIANSGSKCYLWKGGVTIENDKIRKNIEYRLWREAVFKRDNWTCQKYHTSGGELNAHHIKNFADFPDLRTSIDNGITLSKKAHKEFHKIYGNKNTTMEQLIEFLNNK